MSEAPGALQGTERFRTRGAWEEEQQAVILLLPRYGRGGFGRFLQRWLRAPPVRVRLDDVGSFIWLRLDGRRSVAELAEDLRERFGSRIEPAGERLATFLRQLQRGGWIEAEA